MMVNCDKCKSDFEVDIKVKKVIKDIEKTFFKCPHCGEIYTAFFTNAKVRKMQEEIRDIRNKFKSNENIGEKVKLETKYKKLNRKIKKEMNMLKCRFERF